jgi:hypothetical protein
MTEPSGTFEDGSGSFYYQGGATCMWRIKPEDAGNIHLNFNYFDTEEGYDKVTVFDGTTKIAEFSGSQIPPQITATSGIMFITWNTNQAENHQGWEAFYEIDNVGIAEDSGIEELLIYPNPTSGQMQVSFIQKTPGPVNFRLFNNIGQTVYSENILSVSGQISHDLDAGHLSPGMYFLDIKTSQGSTIKKVIVR